MSETNVKATLVTGNPEVDSVILKAQNFWDKNGKIASVVLGAIIVIVGGWFLYKTYVVLPAREKANDTIFPAEEIFDKMTQTGFSKDSINMVLNGGNGITGVLSIAKNYGSTPAGNRAKIIASACYMRTNDFNNAVKYLKDVSSTDATQIQTTVYTMLGDSYSELKKSDDALEYYQKAAKVNEKDEFMTPEALFKAGLYAETIGKNEIAIDCYTKIRDNYPKSSHAQEMDKYLARLGVVK
jgi:tetratricopeptide (TPR) repeat protein